MSERIVVYVTAPVDKARDLAAALVQAQLAACVNIVPSVRSIYRWKGEVCEDEESLLVIKSRRSAFEALRARVVELHPYEVPEVIALPIEAGHGAYLDWLDDNVSLK
ncbi:MAG: divalent-cation tolerance protein CutA [Myxococcales bacterium]|nr:divalent-cation tolerance protein CutA [Myxococcales bacterium]